MSNKKYVVELSGDWQGVDMIIYLKREYFCSSMPNYLDPKKLPNDCSAYVSISNDSKNCIVRSISSAQISNNRNFVLVSIENPLQLFDLKKVKSNVPIKVTRTHSTIGWATYGVALISHKVKRLFKESLNERMDRYKLSNT